MDTLPRIPTDVRSFEVRCRIGQFVMDSDDPDRAPDLAAVGGTVTIEPDLRRPVRINGDTPLDTRVVGVNGLEFQIDPATGLLLHPDGQPGVELVDPSDPHLDPQDWTYTATVRPDVGRSWSVTFGAPPDGAGIVNIGGLAGVDISPGAGSNPVQQVVDARDETRTLATNADAAATRAEQSATDADTSATYAAEVAYGQPLEVTDATTALLATSPATATGRALAARGPVTVYDYGAIGDGTTDDTAAIQAAADAAAAFSLQATLHIPAGTYRISDTITVTTNLEAGGAELRYHGTGTALVCGDRARVLFDRTFNTPSLRYSTGSVWDGTSVGVEFVNLNACRLSTRTIVGFETGVLCIGRGHGFAYNTMTVGFLNTNHRNLVLSQENRGWANQNTFSGGRFQVINSRGAVMGDPNCHHVLMQWDGGNVSGPNNNTFTGCSFEGWDYSHYRVKMVGARYNTFYNCRWEVYGTPPNCFIRSASNSWGNHIHRGYDAWKIISEADESSNDVSVADGSGE